VRKAGDGAAGWTALVFLELAAPSPSGGGPLDNLWETTYSSRDGQGERSMGKSAEPALLQGTLDLLILHALQRGSMHGYAIAQTIHVLSDEVLRVEEGSLYPALYRLELEGAITGKWGLSENNRKAKYYAITKAGKRLVGDHAANWHRLSTAVQRVLAR